MARGEDDPAGRLLALVGLLRQRAGGAISFAAIREALAPLGAYAGPPESARRTFERDKRALRDAGIAVSWSTLHSGYRLDEPRSVALTPADAALLREAAAVVADGPLAPDALGAVERLTGGVSETGDGPVVVHHPLLDAPVVRDRVPRLMTACFRRLPVRFHYEPEGGGESEPRMVDPWGVYAVRGRWYLIGRCHDRNARRTFRVGRMEAVEIVGLPDGAPRFTVPAEFDLRAAAGTRPWDWPQHPPVDVVLAVVAELAPVLARQLGGQVRLTETGVSRTVTWVDGLEPLLLEWMPRVRVVAPADLAARRAAGFAAVARRHGVR